MRVPEPREDTVFCHQLVEALLHLALDLLQQLDVLEQPLLLSESHRHVLQVLQGQSVDELIGVVSSVVQQGLRASYQVR